MAPISLDDLLRRDRQRLRRGPAALIFAEDNVEVASTVRHALNIGFPLALVFGAEAIVGALEEDPAVVPITHDVHRRGGVEDAVNRVIAAAPGQWLHYCYNAEYLYHPFGETRDVVELLAFHTEERREALITYVVDLYADDLTAHPNAVSLEGAMFDGRGYYALGRYRDRESRARDRQLDVFGGLRWRFEEHIPPRSRRIDRVGIFRAKKGLTLRPDHTLSDEEMNTIACPWHHNLTAAIASFRAAKALTHNPGSRAAIRDFRWPGSVPFEWSSQQLMDRGFIEPGQWF